MDEVDAISAFPGKLYGRYYGFMAGGFLTTLKPAFSRKTSRKTSSWTPSPWGTGFVSFPANSAQRYGAEYYDRILFEGKTFDDIQAQEARSS